ncbi:hypothetical protein PPL_11015 [Heterostelium album PN500]|uniref:Uncharacterized protein n=1 Tax=Heterostelium pallidum (strain ATCC 26659 / Pp 5 / PN500) TaxID=670386 RepID=D3BSP6_HETP5|nr:hypothetical protein PPL_11015 [Heterostelium album PN500]EFA75511.1 hypothetical protein PPL_11015 [Heterostelium album PN500]|eukprot:XP_020427645.1 hypothetical protein PPL_11015 [Heterostelium album PN500]
MSRTKEIITVQSDKELKDNIENREQCKSLSLSFDELEEIEQYLRIPLKDRQHKIKLDILIREYEIVLNTASPEISAILPGSFLGGQLKLSRQSTRGRRIRSGAFDNVKYLVYHKNNIDNLLMNLHMLLPNHPHCNQTIMKEFLTSHEILLSSGNSETIDSFRCDECEKCLKPPKEEQNLSSTARIKHFSKNQKVFRRPDQFQCLQNQVTEVHNMVKDLSPNIISEGYPVKPEEEEKEEEVEEPISRHDHISTLNIMTEINVTDRDINRISSGKSLKGNSMNGLIVKFLQHQFNSEWSHPLLTVFDSFSFRRPVYSTMRNSLFSMIPYNVDNDNWLFYFIKQMEYVINNYSRLDEHTDIKMFFNELKPSTYDFDEYRNRLAMILRKVKDNQQFSKGGELNLGGNNSNKYFDCYTNIDIYGHSNIDIEITTTTSTTRRTSIRPRPSPYICEREEANIKKKSKVKVVEKRKTEQFDEEEEEESVRNQTKRKRNKNWPLESV